MFLLDVLVRRPRPEDYSEIKEFFSRVIKDTFEKEGIGHLIEDIDNELESKLQYFKNDLESEGESRYFLLLVDKEINKIIGTIEYGQASELIEECTKGALSGCVEVGTVFVDTAYQNKGLGSLLLSVMFLTLHNHGITEFCLDSGYTIAQKIWKKKFGEPSYLLKDYWGKDVDHLIWKLKTNDMLVAFRI